MATLKSAVLLRNALGKTLGKIIKEDVIRWGFYIATSFSLELSISLY